MLLRAAIDEGIPSDNLEGDTARSAAAHRRFLQVLIEDVRLVIPNSAGLDNLKAAVAQSPHQYIKSLWLTALPRLRHVAHAAAPVAPISEIDDVAVLTRLWRGEVRSVFAEPTRAIVMGLPSEWACSDNSVDPELVRWDLVDSSNLLASARAEQRSDVTAGTDREDVWRAKFADLASGSSEIHILDRYAGTAMASRPVDGLRWLLEKCLSVSSTRVSLVTATTREYSVSDIVTAAHTHFRQLVTGEVSLRLVIAPENAFRVAHARHVRFDRSAAVLVEPGIDIFNSRTAPQTFPCYLAALDGALERETEVRRHRVHIEDFRAPLRFL